VPVSVLAERGTTGAGAALARPLGVDLRAEVGCGQGVPVGLEAPADGVLDLLRRMLLEEGLEEPDQERSIRLRVTLPGLAIEVVHGGQRLDRHVAGGKNLLREVVGLPSLG